MATNKPRIHLSFEPEFYDLIIEISELTGKRKSQVVNDLLSNAYEPLKKLVEALRFASKGVPDDIQEAIVSKIDKSIDKSQKDLFGLQIKAVDVIDDLILKIERESENVE